jgi:hypothetical protein
MPTFYFDFEDGHVVKDDDGIVLPDIAAAEREAVDAAVALARDVLSDQSRTVRIKVRNEAKELVLAAVVTLEISRSPTTS